MKQFNLAEYLKNPERKIVTRDGREIKRILCVDAKGNYPIIALIKSKDEKEEYPLRYTVSGKYDSSCEKQMDLFFVPEKYERWVNIYMESKEDIYFGDLYSSEKEAKDNINSSANCVATVKIEWEE